MGLKGYRLWVMGQLDSNVQRPTAVPSAASACARSRAMRALSRRPAAIWSRRVADSTA
jgi:hypothetical protein